MKIFVNFLVLLLLAACSENLMTDPVESASSDPVLKSAKPMPVLIGTTHETATGPTTFEGTVDFQISGGLETYGITYEVLETSGNPANIIQLNEKFFIYDPGSDRETGPVYLTGTNSGIIHKMESFLTNGVVESAAGPFEAWEGRSVHVRGEISFNEFGVPMVESIFRIN